jgi:hypothetical protein
MFNIKYSFPESFWPNSSELYFSRINKGLNIASNSSVCILGLARDCERQIEYNLGRVKTLCNFFKKSYVKIFENDSEDSTPIIIKNWESNNKNFKSSIKKYNLPKNQPDYSLCRRERMSFYRNQYLEEKIWLDYDYTIIYDFDLFGGFSYEGILNSIGFEKDWLVIGSNSLYYDIYNEKPRRLYYDTYALTLIEDNPESDYSKEKQERYNLLQFNRGEEPFEVKSVFGGIAIYKSHSLIDCKYTSHLCDHQTIAEQIRYKGGKIFLNPSQIVLLNEHIYCKGVENGNN